MIKLKIENNWYKRTLRNIYKNNVECLYLFGDNKKDKMSGYVPYKTQAVIRGLPNSFGISTKYDRYHNYNSYMSYLEYMNSIREEMRELKKLLHKYKYIVFPKDGIGSGEAINNNPKLKINEKDKFSKLAYNEIVKLITEFNNNEGVDM